MRPRAFLPKFMTNEGDFSLEIKSSVEHSQSSFSKEIIVKKGFTLIELLIVVAIIAILAAIAVPNFLEAQVRSKVSRAKADMRSMATAIESYAVDNNAAPPLVAPNSPRALTGSGAINGPSVFYSTSTDGISSRFIRVTTPVAYISSAFQDPFINQAVRFAIDPDTNAANPGYDTYDYVDAKSVTPEGVLGGTRGASISSGASWHLVSAGPDKINAFGGGTEAYTAAAREKGVDYDPTNGTISAGDIVRIGAGPGPIFTIRPAVDRIQNRYYP